MIEYDRIFRDTINVLETEMVEIAPPRKQESLTIRRADRRQKRTTKAQPSSRVLDKP